jgi:diguanylate cyclase (GGDEF)-like protein
MIRGPVRGNRREGVGVEFGTAPLAGQESPEACAARLRAPLLPRQISDAEFALFRGVSRRRDVHPHELIFARGELGRSMFIVESGAVRLEFGDAMPEKSIGPREFFGELALFIGNHARVANAVAAEDTVLHVVEHAAFEALLEREPALLAQFMRRSFAYLVASEQQLIASLKRRNEDLMLTLDSLRQARTQLDTAERLVQTDELTGLCNRRGLYAWLDGLGARREPGRQVGLLLVDLDRFKQVNDLGGHLTGDRVLRAVAQEVQAAAGPTDLPCRLGGDEFALLAHVRDAAELEARARQVVAAVRALRFPGKDRAFTVTVSVGGSLCAPGAQWSAWYSEADSLLYEVKGAGGDHCKVGR